MDEVTEEFNSTYTFSVHRWQLSSVCQDARLSGLNAGCHRGPWRL